METKRLFLAISLPDPIKEALFAYFEPHRSHPALKKCRWTKKENLHITTLFLGDVAIDQIEQQQALISEQISKHNAFDLRFTKARFAPSERHPRMIWIEFEKEPGFQELVLKLQSTLNTEKREPHAHITCARLKFLKHAESIIFAPLQLDALHVECCDLMQSTLTNEGPIYTLIARYNLCTG